MKIALLGRRSFLSIALKEYLQSTSAKVFVISSDEIILDQPDSIKKKLESIKPDYAFNCIAMTNVDEAEKNRSLAQILNHTFAKNFAIACEKTGTKGIHFSTDYVFDGKKNDPYTEQDIPNPMSTYGKTKLDGETDFLFNHPKGLIIRVSWLFGPGKSNYVEKFFLDILSNQKFRVIKDQIGTPSYTFDVAKFSFLLKDYEGIFHLANSGFATKKECAEFIAKQLQKKGLNFDLKKLEAVSLDELNLTAKRPKFSALSCDKAKAVLNQPIPSYQEGIIHYMNRYLKEKGYE